MTVMDLTQVLQVLEPFGAVDPTTLAGPVRQSLGKYGEGLFIEEGTTNLLPKPSPRDNTTTGYFARGAGALSIVSGGAVGPYAFRATCATAGTLSAAQSPTTHKAAATAGLVYSGQVMLRPLSKGQASVTAVMEFYTAANAFISASSGSTVAASAGQWTRLKVENVTAPANTAYIVVYGNAGSAAVGDVMDSDAYQVEQKAYCTSYCDGALATLWNDSRNLYSQSFEDGTTGAFVGNNASVANSTAYAYEGTHSLRVTATAAATFYQATLPYTTNPVTPGKTYSTQARIRSNQAGKGLAVQIDWYTAAGVYISSTNDGGPASVTSGTTYTDTVSGVAPATAGYASLSVVCTVTGGGNNTIGDSFYVDAIGFAEGTGLAAYRWTGADNASSSVRVAAQVKHDTVSTLAPALTFAAWVRPGSTTGTRSLLSANSGGSTPLLALAASGSASFTSNVDVAAQVAITYQPGDLIFMVGVLAADAKTYTVYASVNGGTVVSSTSGVSATAFTGLTRVTLGALSIGPQAWLNGTVEQVLVYNRALTAAEVAALAFSGIETNYASDTGIVLAAATGIVRGTVQAATAAGAGSYRVTSSVNCYAKPYLAISADPDDDTGLLEVSVAAGSGIGSGTRVRLGGSYYTVQRVSSPGGVLDRLYIA